MLEFDKKYFSKYNLIAGIDEAGRGPLAGPVVAASVVFENGVYIEGVNDSKKISEKKRNKLYDEILVKALHVGIGIVHSSEIDEINILNATKKAMKISILDLDVKPEMLLVDGNQIEFSNYNQESVIKGDSKSFSIASASIVAKVTRDRIMQSYAEVLPQYGFERHKGYGTKYHLESISKFKASIIHRKTFRPIKDHLAPFDYYIGHDIIDKLLIQVAGDYLIKRGHHISQVSNLSISSIKKDKKNNFLIESNIDIGDVFSDNCRIPEDYRIIKIKFKKGSYDIQVN